MCVCILHAIQCGEATIRFVVYVCRNRTDAMRNYVHVCACAFMFPLYGKLCQTPDVLCINATAAANIFEFQFELAIAYFVCRMPSDIVYSSSIQCDMRI